MTAFVFGATGYTGRAVIDVLCERRLGAVAHVRPDSSRLGEWRARFETSGAVVDTTPWAVDELKATFLRTEPAVVFALLGTTRSRGKDVEQRTGTRDTYESVDYGLTVMLLEALEAARRAPRFVYLSAAGVREGATTGYMGARARVEAELRRRSIPYTIARPSFITGADRDDGRAGERIGAAVADAALGAFGFLGARRLRDRYKSTTNVDLASALVRLGFDTRAENRVVESEGLRAKG